MQNKAKMDYSRLEDDRLLLYTGTGDEAAFHQLYQNTARAIYGYILSFLKNPTDAEEVMQETYLKVWVLADSYKSQGKPLAWMFTIAKNLCYMKFRQRKHEYGLSFQDLQELEPGELCPQIEMAPDKLMLLSALETLKEEDRQIVLLHEVGGLKHREIGECMGLGVATVLSRHSRAMKRLHEYLEKNRGTPR